MSEASDTRPKRQFLRTPLSILVQYRFSPLEDFSYEYTTDLSPGGVFLRTDEPRALGSVIFLQFTLRDGSRLMEGTGKVVRVIQRGTPGQVPGMGVQFTGFDDESLALIRTLCEATERAGLRLKPKP